MKKTILFSLVIAFVLSIGANQLQGQTHSYAYQKLLKADPLMLQDLQVANLNDQSTNKKTFVVQIDSIISTNPANDPEKVKEIKTYYDNGKIHTQTFLYLINNEWENSNRYVYSYNEDGRITERLYKAWEEEQWVASSKNSYIYYNYGELQTRLKEKYINGGWVNDRLYSYDYDSNHYFAEVLSQKWEDNEWENFFIINTTNNENGWYLVDVVKLWEDNEWVKSDSTIYDYDDNGNNTIIDSKEW